MGESPLPSHNQYYLDHFTGTQNRLFLNEVVPQLLKESSLNKQKVALLMIDMDNFKYINDSFGHLVGDKVIKEIANLLLKVKRDNDYLIRYAGDEFVLVLTNAEFPFVYKVIKDIMEEIRNFSFVIAETEIAQTLSIGFALFPDDADNLEDLILRADEALYLAKRRGKNAHVYFREVDISQISLKRAMHLFPSKEFINRKQELNLIADKILEVKNNSQIRGVIVFGGSGVGKSRLFQEVIKKGRENLKGDILVFNALPKNSLYPCYLIFKIFEEYLQEMLSEGTEIIPQLKSLDPKKQNILHSTLPLLKGFFSFPEKTTPVESQLLFETYAELLDILCKRKEIIFLGIDNFHYADTASLEFFNCL